jgi:serine/threonine-protein kinase
MELVRMKTCPACQKSYSNDLEFCPHDGGPLVPQAGDPSARLAAGLARRFRIIRLLGSGGMGSVFLAEQLTVGSRLVALKVLNRNLLDAPDFLRRFQAEAASTGRIHHTNVVTIYESGQAEDGAPYIAMEFLEGESLRQVLQRRGALPIAEVAEILRQVARGLNAAHKLAVIHRDIKPDNIFLTKGDDGEMVAKVVDFGIAKLRESSDHPGHTSTGLVLGTPAYMSVEQASGMRSDQLDARSDIYSLGVVVYEMLSGRVPFDSDTPLGYLRKHLLEQPPPLRVVAAALGIPPAVESVVLKALAKNRDERYAAAPDFARAFSLAAQPSSPAEAPAAMDAPTTRVLARINSLDGMSYVWIPPGRFRMGCSPGDGEFRNDEKPLHEVIITKGFWLGQTAVTVEAYKRFAEATKKAMPPDPKFNPGWSQVKMPMVNVGWRDARDYCTWAGGRLPTEAEWEYAARAGTPQARYGPLDEVAWYNQNSRSETHPVGEKKPNALGLYDALGNVWEWVADWFDEEYYQHSPFQDPRGPANGEQRVVRGGSWAGEARFIRVSSRDGVLPGDAGHGLGFRCALEKLP